MLNPNELPIVFLKTCPLKVFPSQMENRNFQIHKIQDGGSNIPKVKRVGVVISNDQM